MGQAKVATGARRKKHPYPSKVKCYYSCEEDGHLSRNCPNKKPRSPTNVVEYHGQKYEEMMAKTIPMEEKRDMSTVFCYYCRETGHFTDECPEKKKGLSHIQCYKCKNMGHYISGCPEGKMEEAAKPNPSKKGHGNHVHMKGNYKEPSKMNGMFSIK